MQPQDSSQALAQLQSYQIQNPQDIIKKEQQSLGIPAAQQQVSGLREAITNTTNLLNRVAPSVYGRTSNSLVTGAQANRQISNEQAPLQSQLTNQGQQYGMASGDLSDLMRQSETNANAAITGQNQKLDQLKTLYTALYGREQDALSHKLEQDKLAASIAASKASGSGGGLGSLFAGLGGASGATTGAAAPQQPASAMNEIQTNAYNDARKRIDTALSKFKNDPTKAFAEVLSDYNATKKSADYGNVMDKTKLLYYQQLFPQFFPTVAPSQSANYAPAAVLANGGSLRF